MYRVKQDSIWSALSYLFEVTTVRMYSIQRNLTLIRLNIGSRWTAFSRALTFIIQKMISSQFYIVLL